MSRTHANHPNATVNGDHLERQLEFLWPNEQEWERQSPEYDEPNKLRGCSRHNRR